LARPACLPSLVHRVTQCCVIATSLMRQQLQPTNRQRTGKPASADCASRCAAAMPSQIDVPDRRVAVRKVPNEWRHQRSAVVGRSVSRREPSSHVDHVAVIARLNDSTRRTDGRMDGRQITDKEGPFQIACGSGPRRSSVQNQRHCYRVLTDVDDLDPVSTY